MNKEYPILEFDPAKEALINPKATNKHINKIPEHCVITFFNDAIGNLQKQGKLTRIGRQKSELGTHPIYQFQHKDMNLVLFHPGVGAPLAAGLFEEIIARGCRKFIVCGGAGVLDNKISRGHIVIPTAAIRDEGTSYHYLPPSREVEPSFEAVQAIKIVCDEAEIPYILSKTWTTDAYFRETPKKIALRKSEGCLTVEMEAAALFAVAKFRDVKIGQILYGGDDVSGHEWDSRDWLKVPDLREKLIWLSAEACLKIRED